MRYLLIILFLSACGGNYHVDPIEVHHTISVDFEQITLYCQDLCKNSEYDNCESDCFYNTVNAIMSGVRQ